MHRKCGCMYSMFHLPNGPWHKRNLLIAATSEREFLRPDRFLQVLATVTIQCVVGMACRYGIQEHLAEVCRICWQLQHQDLGKTKPKHKCALQIVQVECSRNKGRLMHVAVLS